MNTYIKLFAFIAFLVTGAFAQDDGILVKYGGNILSKDDQGYYLQPADLYLNGKLVHVATPLRPDMTAIFSAQEIAAGVLDQLQGVFLSTTYAAGSFGDKPDSNYWTVGTEYYGQANGHGGRFTTIAPNLGGSQLLNISTRVKVPAGDVMIGGFVVSGSAKPVLIRGAGPSLTKFGVTGELKDPKITVYNSKNEPIMTNDDYVPTAWSDEVTAKLGAFPFDVVNGVVKEAAILTVLEPGTYTVHLAGADGEGGDAIVEVYDATSAY